MSNGIYTPTTIQAQSFQSAWIEAANHLMSLPGHRTRNLIVQIHDVSTIDTNIHRQYEEFCKTQGLLAARAVAYTIFPFGLIGRKSEDEIYHAYNRAGGMYERLQRSLYNKRRYHSWGTYFRRMTNYERKDDIVNQLGHAINAARSAIQAGRTPGRAAFTILIPKPGGETRRPIGGPCLNYLALQFESESDDIRCGLLAVYRNHDFLSKAYGNYWGLVSTGISPRNISSELPDELFLSSIQMERNLRRRLL